MRLRLAEDDWVAVGDEADANAPKRDSLARAERARDRLLRELDRLDRRVDAIEAELPNAGRLVMSEADLQLEVNSSDARLRKEYQAAFQRRLEWMQEVSRVRSIPLLPIETSRDVAEQVRELLGYELDRTAPP